MAYKLGKRPARHAISFRFADFFDAKKLPKPPPVFGHYGLVKQFYGLGNDKYGNCVAGGTLVSASDIKGAFKAPYNGSMINFRLSSGKNITVTPKHSLLTPNGFASADTVKEGDYLVSTCGTQVLPGFSGSVGKTDRNNCPSPIEQIFASLLLGIGPVSKVMPRSIDLHGDEKFVDGDVDVVASDRFLWGEGNTFLSQPDTQNEVGAARQLKSLFVRSGALLQSALTRWFSFDGNIGLCGDGPALACAQLGVSQSQRLGLSPDLMSGSHNGFGEIFSRDISSLTSGIFKRGAFDVESNGVVDIPVFSTRNQRGNFGRSSASPIASVDHPSPDGLPTDAHFFSDLRNAFPGLVEADRVVNIDIQRNVRTHVYDLSTDSRWYIANGIVSHNCVWAGAAHETQVWSVAGGRDRARFLIKNVLSDYSAVTGFDPAKPETDQGTDMQAAASYRRKVGILAASGKRHTIDSYIALRPGDLDQLFLAMWLLGATGIGLQMPSSAMDQFDKLKPWTVPTRPRMIGGHYVPGVGRNRAGNIVIVTWGKVTEITPDFYDRFNDESVAYVSLELLNDKNLSPEGFDADGLRKQLASLG